MNRVLVLVQNGIRILTAPTNTTKKGRRSRCQSKPVITTKSACECKLAPRFQYLTDDEILAIEIAERDYRNTVENKVERFGIYLNRGERIQAAGEFEAMLRIVSAKFGGKTTDQDSCESRSHSRSKLRYALRVNRRNHPRNAALLAA
ncbi:MAG: hypothetical protein WC866_03105 [Patescibacteria group bacterium]|jgi:hypothetical protein